MKVRAEKIVARDLQPGDLFSTAGPDYWDRIADREQMSVGERVYIRTNAPTILAPDGDIEVYKITIIKESSCDAR